MKMTKKIMSLAIVFAMVMAMSVSALAADITITEGKEGETYTIYKVFDATFKGEAVAYTINVNDGFYDVISTFEYDFDGEGAKPAEKVFTLVSSQNNADVKVVTPHEGFTGNDSAVVKALAAALSADTSKPTAVASDVADETGKITVTDLATGYYFIDTSLGSLCALDSMLDSITIREKNTVPTLTKTVDDNEAEIGETVNFTITVTDGIGTDAAITVHDTMDEGFAVPTNFVVKANDATVAVTPVMNGNDFTITIPAETVAGLDEGQKIVITYSAVVDTDAVLAGMGTNKNTAYLTYQKQQSAPVEVSVNTYVFQLNKYTTIDGKKTDITGAEFELYEKVVGETVTYDRVYVELVDGAYRVTQTQNDVQIQAGKVEIYGLDSDKTYVLLETKAPAGYNIYTQYINAATGTKTVEDNTVTYTSVVEVENNTGTELPSTGGIGTTIFYALGGLMAVGAGVLLVAKKRMEA